MSQNFERAYERAHKVRRANFMELMFLILESSNQKHNELSDSDVLTVTDCRDQSNMFCVSCDKESQLFPRAKCSVRIVEGSLEIKLPIIWTDEKQKCEESEKRREEERRSKKRKSQKKEDPGARKGRKVAKDCVFPMICGSAGSKSRLA